MLFSNQAYSYGAPIIEAKGPSYSIVKTASEKLEFFEDDYDILMGPFGQGEYPHPQLCVFVKNPEKFEWITYPATLEELNAQLATDDGARTLVYYALGYDGDISYLSLRQFLGAAAAGGFVDQVAYNAFLEKNNLTIVWMGTEERTGAVSMFLARK